MFCKYGFDIVFQTRPRIFLSSLPNLDTLLLCSNNCPRRIVAGFFEGEFFLPMFLLSLELLLQLDLRICQSSLHRLCILSAVFHNSPKFARTVGFPTARTRASRFYFLWLLSRIPQNPYGILRKFLFLHWVV